MQDNEGYRDARDALNSTLKYVFDLLLDGGEPSTRRHHCSCLAVLGAVWYKDLSLSQHAREYCSYLAMIAIYLSIRKLSRLVRV